MNGVIFIGLQASGKSSFYLSHFYHTHVRLNLDMLKTRHREGILFDACLKAKQAVVIDNTNPTLEDRTRYIDRFRVHNFDVDGYYFSSNLRECLTRNAKRDGKARIPDVGIKGTYNKLVLPNYDEGFNRLYYVISTQDGFTVKAWNNEV